MRAGVLAALVALWSGPAPTAQIERLSYEAASALTLGHVDFETLPHLPEPGHVLTHGYAFAGGRIGERFEGQSLRPIIHGEDLYDEIGNERPTLPLALESGAPNEGLSVSFHRAFRSNALYPLGPRRWPVPEARGEGAAAILFDRDICAFALRIHTEYVDDLGTNATHSGAVDLRFFARDGALIARLALELPAGISSLGFRRPGNRNDIAGVLVTNRDPGGVSLDDIRFGCPVPVG